MKKFFVLLLTAIMLVTSLACAGAGKQDQNVADALQEEAQTAAGPGLGGTVEAPYLITAGCTAPVVTDPTNGFLAASITLNEKLMELSGGTMGFELVMGGVYGSTVQHFAQLKAGTLDAFISGFDVATNLSDTEDFNAVAMPFVFDDDAHMDAFMKSDLWKEMVEKMRKANGILIAGLYSHQCPRILTCRYEVIHPEDVKGMKIRVPESQVQIKVWTAAGANPMQIAATEMYSALDTGVADAQDNDMVGSGSLRMFEVTPYYTEIDYIRQCLMVYMSEITWNKMSEQERAWWDEALAAACEAGSSAYTAKYDAAKQTVVENGGTIVEFDYDEWKTFFTNIVLEQFDGKLFREGLYTEIQKTK